MKLSKNRPFSPKLSGYHSTEGGDCPLFFYLVGMGMWWLSNKGGGAEGEGEIFFFLFFWGGGVVVAHGWSNK